jgi:hypothetical protein
MTRGVRFVERKKRRTVRQQDLRISKLALVAVLVLGVVGVGVVAQASVKTASASSAKGSSCSNPYRVIWNAGGARRHIVRGDGGPIAPTGLDIRPVARSPWRATPILRRGRTVGVHPPAALLANCPSVDLPDATRALSAVSHSAVPARTCASLRSSVAPSCARPTKPRSSQCLRISISTDRYASSATDLPNCFMRKSTFRCLVLDRWIEAG